MSAASAQPEGDPDPRDATPKLSRSTRRWLVAVAWGALLGTLPLLGSSGGMALDAFTPDTIEHLAIANAFAHGRGFVDPVQWSYALDLRPPIPAAAVRPPVLPLLLSVPLAAGATLPAVIAFHAAWAAVVLALFIRICMSVMRWPAAIGAGIALGLSVPWQSLAVQPMTEISAVGALIGVVAAAPAAGGSVRGALLCVGATWLAWLTRPNLGALVLAVAVATAWQQGRRCLSSRPLYVYVLGFVAAVMLTQLVYTAATGAGLYSGYDAEFVLGDTHFFYGREAVGTSAFFSENRERILAVWASNLDKAFHLGFVGLPFFRIGWLLVPALAFGLFARDEHRVVRRVCAFSVAGLTLTALLNYSSGMFPRYLVLSFAPLVLLVFGMADAAIHWLSPRLERFGDAGRWALRAVTAGLALGLLSGPALAGRTMFVVFEAIDRASELPGPDIATRRRAICEPFSPGTLVATPRPWQVTLLCGNPTIRLPVDLGQPEIAARFIEDKRPGYLVVSTEHPIPWLSASDAWTESGRSGQWSVFEHREIERLDRWDAPPPVACAGLGSACGG